MSRSGLMWGIAKTEDRCIHPRSAERKTYQVADFLVRFDYHPLKCKLFPHTTPHLRWDGDTLHKNWKRLTREFYSFLYGTRWWKPEEDLQTENPARSDICVTHFLATLCAVMQQSLSFASNPSNVKLRTLQVMKSAVKVRQIFSSAIFLSILSAVLCVHDEGRQYKPALPDHIRIGTQNTFSCTCRRKVKHRICCYLFRWAIWWWWWPTGRSCLQARSATRQWESRRSIAHILQCEVRQDSSWKFIFCKWHK